MANKRSFATCQFIIFIILLSACGTIEVGIEREADKQNTHVAPTASPTATLEPTEEVIIPTPSPFNEDELFIRGALAERLGVEPEDLQFDISINIGSHAVGTVSNDYFLAAKDLGSWVILYVGQGTPYCTDVDPYQVPIEMVPECLRSNELVVRTDDDLQIGMALAEYLGVPLEDVNYLVGQKTVMHANGNVSNGYFLAFKNDQDWIIVYGGQANPPCSLIESYWFPTDMVPECLDENDNLVIRSYGNEVQIGEALASLFAVPYKEFDYTVLLDTGAHAMGHIRGGIFLAAKVGDGWQIIHHGQGTPQCEILDQYQFPTEIVAECVDENHNLIIR